jgi:hypothetical protein
MNVTTNGKGAPVYEPNSYNGPTADQQYSWTRKKLEQTTGRFDFDHANSDFE